MVKVKLMKMNHQNKYDSCMFIGIKACTKIRAIRCKNEMLMRSCPSVGRKHKLLLLGWVEEKTLAWSAPRIRNIDPRKKSYESGLGDCKESRSSAP